MVAELQLIYQGCHVTILKYKYDFIQLFDNLSISFEVFRTPNSIQDNLILP